MVVGFKPQGNKKSIVANTSFPPQDPPPPPKPIVEPITPSVVEPIIIVPPPKVVVPQSPPKVVEKLIVEPITPPQVKLTLLQKIIVLLKKVIRK